MAKQIEGVYENILKYAKDEFLQVGYKEASLRNIAARAGTSTGSIYTRFGNKEGMYTAIVSPVIEELENWIIKVNEQFSQKSSDEQEKTVKKYSKDRIMEMVEYIYNHYDEFKLLLNCSEETHYANFIDCLVEIEIKYSYKFLKSIGKDISKDFSEKLLHLVYSSLYNGIFEIIRHNMPKNEGMFYVYKLKEFYAAGFERLFV